MLKYFLKRLLFSIPTLLAISMVVFGILALAPGDPMGEFAANPAITEAVRENIRKSLGLDQPLPVRYVKWLLAFLQGDMGYSFTSRSPVFTLIWQRLPTTLWIVGIAYIFGVLIAFPLGVISAVKRYSWLDKIISTFSLLGFSLPTFVTGLLLIIIFSVQLNWLPSFYNSTLEIRDFNSLVEQVKQSIMPITVLSLYQGAMLMRFVRSSVTEEIHQEYTEQVFRVPGIGALLIDSISRSDTPVVMAITFIYGILIVIFNLIADLTYSWLDPRVRY